MAMVVLSVLPVGLLQTQATVSKGYWYARSAEFMQTPLMGTLRWMRVFGDTVFAVGIVALAVFIVGMATGRSYKRSSLTGASAAPSVRPPASMIGTDGGA